MNISVAKHQEINHVCVWLKWLAIDKIYIWKLQFAEISENWKKIFISIMWVSE